MRRLWVWALGMVAVLVLSAWWLLLDGDAPDRAPGEFDITEWRALIEASEGARPTSVRMEVVGTDIAPRWATEAGNFGNPAHMAYTAFQIAWPDRSVVIGGAADEATLREMAQSDAAQFNHGAYKRLEEAMLAADEVWITHEHLDHVMAIARHPDPEALAPKLRLNEHQIAMMPRFAIGALDPAIAGVRPETFAAPRLIAPGVVMAPAPGHTRGSQVFYVVTADANELLLIGDIVWTMTNIENLKTRPRLLQFVVFDPNEARAAVLRQVRALHDLVAAEPDLIIVPSHDRSYLERLVDGGLLELGFELPVES